MKRVLSSYRWRRRLLRSGVAGLAVAFLLVIGFRYSNTGGERDLPRPRPGKPQLVAAPPKTVPVSASDSAVISRVARAFVASAVLRRHLVASWPLVTQNMREDLTRAQWATGAIPVVPYPAGDVRDVRWKQTYSYRGRVGLRVLFEPKLGARSRAEQFDIELVPAKPGQPGRWLVDSWIPADVSLEATLPPGSKPAPPQLPRARLPSAWLIALVSVVVGSIVLVPVSISIRGWLRHRRAVRAFARSL